MKYSFFCLLLLITYTSGICGILPEEKSHESMKKNSIVSRLYTYYTYFKQCTQSYLSLWPSTKRTTYYNPDGYSSFEITHENEDIFDKQTLFYQKWLRQTYTLCATHKKIICQTGDVLGLLGSGVILYMGIKKLLHDPNKTIGLVTTAMGTIGASTALCDLYSR